MSDPGAPTPADLLTGSRRLVWGTSAHLTFVVLLIAMNKIVLPSGSTANFVKMLVVISLLLIGQTFILWGWWRLTAPAHARAESGWNPRLRMLSCAISALPLCTAAIGVVALTLPKSRWAPSSILLEMGAAAIALFPFAIAAAVAAQCIVIRSTHRTLRDTTLARLSEATAAIAPLCALVYAGLFPSPLRVSAEWIILSVLFLLGAAHLLVALRLHARLRRPAAPTPAQPPALAPLPA